MYNKIRKTKKAQIGETMTWVFATIIIIVILVISIFIASHYLGKIKLITMPTSGQSYDLPIAKSFYSYLLTKNESGQTVYSQIEKDKNLNDFDGNLSLDLFNGQEKIKTYQGSGINSPLVWLGAIKISSQNPNGIGVENKYFGPQDFGITSNNLQFYELIKINENESVSLVVSSSSNVK